MSSNPRRTSVTRPDSRALSLKTDMLLKKGATFHSPITPPSSPETTFRPPSLPRRSQTNLDDVLDSHRRRMALTLGNIVKSLAAQEPLSSVSPSTKTSFRDNSIPIPRGVLTHTLDTIMAKEPEVERRVLRPRTRRNHKHQSDSGLGTSIASTKETKEKATAASVEKPIVKSSAVTRSAAGVAKATNLPGLSTKATNRIYEHTLKPLLAKPSFKNFHPLLLDCPGKIQDKEILCLRDLEKTILLTAPEKTNGADLYLDFCLTSIRCIQATVEYLNDHEQTRPRDLPYTSGYFIDLVDQIRHYAEQLADKEKGEMDKMNVDPTDEIKLHGGIHVNGRPAELVRVRKNGTAISLASGKPVDVLEEDPSELIRFKRSVSEQLEDEEEVMRSMARRKKNASPEELAPKKCREPGCNKEFKRPCDLTKHEKTHSRPWKCPVPTCKYHEYGWPTEKEMDRHHNDKHSSAPPMYECLYKPCPYKSKRESNCKQHMEKAHGWTYVRTKSNGKKPGLLANSINSAEPTPQLQNLPTPSSDYSMGVATPPDDFASLYNNMDFPTYNTPSAADFNIPQELSLDYSPMDNGTPSSEFSGLDRNSAYQDIGNDFTLNEDIYGAHVQVPAHGLPTPVHNMFNKQLQPQFQPAPQQFEAMPRQFAQFTATDFCQSQPAQISPIGHGNTMLYTPTSLAEVDEVFDEHQQDYSGMNYNTNGGDFVLFPGRDAPKPTMHGDLFVNEVPSMGTGLSQHSSQLDLLMQAAMNMDWSQVDFQQFSQH